MVDIFTKARWLQQDEKRLDSMVRYALHHPEAGSPCIGRFAAIPRPNEETLLELEKQRAHYADEVRRLALRRALYESVRLSNYQKT